MKTPGNAFLIQSRGAPFWSVSIRCVRVLGIDTAAQVAVVEMGTEARRLRGVEVTVPFARLASDQSRALVLAAAELAKLSTEAAVSAAQKTAGAGDAATAASAA
jgi:hypothetical protein